MSGATVWDLSPEQALQRLRELPPDVPVVVDLDETLLLDGSVERFLGSLRPALLARLLLILIERLRPWRRDGELHRDYWRVRLLSLLLPWGWWQWRRAAPRIAAGRVNAPLREALRGRPLILLTHSYQPVAEPLARALLPEAELIACALDRHDRALGKPAQLRARKPDFPLAQAAAITDSSADAPLLAAVAHPLRVVWPQARVTPAFEGQYLPLLYTERIRRKGQRHFLRNVLQEDFAFFLLAALPLAISMPLLVAGLSLLLLSFWCIYEQGYVDNDRMAALYEADNPRPPSPAQLAYGAPYGKAGLWSLAFAVPGCWLAARAQALPFLPVFLAWLAVLLALALWYRLYNRVDPDTRIWMFPGLQAFRAYAMAAVAPVTLAGALLLICHVSMRHFEYYLYRKVERSDITPPMFLMRLQLFALALGLFYFSRHGADALPFTQVLPLLLWAGFRARHELRDLVNNFRLLDRRKP